MKPISSTYSNPLDTYPPYVLIRRELIVILRSWRSLALLCMVLCPAGFIMFLMINVPRQILSINTQPIYVLVFLAGLFLMPMFGASAIRHEFDRNTYSMLLMCGLRPHQIFLSKFLAVFALFALILVAVWPGFALEFYFVGTEPRQFIQLMIILLSVGLVSSAGGVALSGLTKTPFHVALIIHLITLGLVLLYGITMHFIQLPFHLTYLQHTTAILSSCVAVLSYPAGILISASLGTLSWLELSIFTFIGLAYTLFYCFLGVWAIHHNNRKRMQAGNGRTVRKGKKYKQVSFPDRRNPLGALEKHLLNQDHRIVHYIMIFICFFCTVALFSFFQRFNPYQANMITPVFVGLNGFFFAIIPLAVVGGVQRELDESVAEQLYMTRLTLNDFYLGKVIGAFAAIAPLVKGVALGYVCFVLTILFRGEFNPTMHLINLTYLSYSIFINVLYAVMFCAFGRSRGSALIICYIGMGFITLMATFTRGLSFVGQMMLNTSMLNRPDELLGYLAFRIGTAFIAIIVAYGFGRAAIEGRNPNMIEAHEK